MKIDLETIDLEVVKNNYPEEYQEEIESNEYCLISNDEYNRIKQKIRNFELSYSQQGLYYTQANYSDENSYDDPTRESYPENVFLLFYFKLFHLMHEEAFTRNQNLLLTSLYEDLKENIAWFYRYPNLIVLSEDIKPYLYRLLKEMENRIST